MTTTPTITRAAYTGGATTYSGIITARQFSNNTTDTLRDVWTPGKIRYVIAALAGAPVAITVDNATGFTLVGARLIRAYTEGGWARVVIESDHGDGNAHETHYHGRDLGSVITPLVQLAGGREPHRLYTTARSAAIRTAGRLHGEGAGRCYGRWDAVPQGTGSQFFVTYDPQNPPPGTSAGTPWAGVIDAPIVLS